MNTTNSKKTGFKIAIAALLLLLSFSLYYTYNLYQEKERNEAQLSEEKQDVIANLNQMSERYKTIVVENDDLNEKLSATKSRIDDLKEALQKSENSLSSLSKYKRKFIELQKELDVILQENDLLKIKNSQLTNSLDSTNVQLQKQEIYSDSLLKQNTNLAGIVKDVAVLQAVALKGFGVIERRSGKLQPTNKARRVDKLRVCFTVVKNTLIPAGDKQLYIQVINPKNNILGNRKQLQFDDDVLRYSLVTKFNYDTNNRDICEFIPAGEKESFEKGRYIVNVFNKNELLSSSEFNLE